jgi:5-methylcytosine-specific restriction endonuclease McrA
MIGSFSSYNGVYIEITKSEHGHGGIGWEFGTCLWSPSKDRRGGDRYGVMREPVKGDLILHFLNEAWEDNINDTRLCGYSFVKDQYELVDQVPPSPGSWGNLAPYYRINLKEYTPFPIPLPFSIIKDNYSNEILDEIVDNRIKYFPFNTYGDTIRTVQGTYLAKCTNRLFTLLMEALQIQININQNASITTDIHLEYSETKRLTKERYFFARNPKLARDAKQAHGYKCQACGFDFLSFYGSLGEYYIEAHHKNPLSERPEPQWSDVLFSKIDDINVLCSNCHRMVHRHKPALELEELIKLIEQQKNH